MSAGALARFGCHGERGAQAYKGVWGGARSAVPGGTAPGGGSGGFAEPALGMGRGGPLFDKSELQTSSGVITQQSPPEAESILVIGCPTEPENLAPFQKCPFELRYTQQSLTENSMLCYGPLVSELWGPRVHGAPNPVTGGGCAPGRPVSPPM